MRRTDARRCKIGGPDGIASSFQVSAYSGEPREASLTRNLFAKEDWRSALADELEGNGPQVALVVDAGAATGDRERLTRAREGPDVGVVGDAGKAQGVRPPAESGEEMALTRPGNVIWP